MGSQAGLNRRNILKYAGVIGAGSAAVPALGAAFPSAAAGKCSGPSPEPIPVQAHAVEGFVEVPGGHLWYWDTGGPGPAVVLVHAASGSAESWPYQQPVLARAGYRVIGYSRRGHYRSSRFTSENAPVGSADLSVLVDHLGLDRFDLVSAALGGYYATDYALLHPARVRSLTVISSFMAIQEDEYLSLIDDLRPPEFDALPTFFKELSPSYRASNPRGLAKWQEIAGRARLSGSAYHHRVATEILWDSLATLRPRAFLITGSSDLYMPPPVMGMIASHIDGCSTLVAPEVGHSANWEIPSAFNRALLRFLRGALIKGPCL